MHITTLMLLNITLSVVICMTLAVTALRSHRELILLAAALGAHAMGYALLALRGQIDEIWSIVVANALIAVAVSFLAESVYRFQRRPSPRLMIWLPVIVVVLVYSWFIDDFIVRVEVGGLLTLAQIIIVLVPLIARHRQTVGRGQYVAIAGFVITLIAMMIRVYYVPNGVTTGSAVLFDASSGYGLVFFSTLVALIMIALGMILMVQERTWHELAASEKQYRQLIEIAQEGVAVLGHERVLFSNAKLAQLLGVPQDVLIGSQFIDYICPDERAYAIERYKARIEGRAEHEAYDLRLIATYSGIRWFRISGVRIQWNGEPATLSFISDIHERKMREEEVRELAYVDSLTQLPNRRLLEDRLSQALSQSARTDAYLAVLFIDLDKLKVLNDARGHKAGDLLLVESARRLRANIREFDTVARLGGDEFVVLLSPLDDDVVRARAQAQIVAEKILRALKTPYVLQVSNDDHTGIETHLGSGSIGVHVFKAPIDSIDTLLDNADAAMYRAKQAGRGRVEMFDELAG